MNMQRGQRETERKRETETRGRPPSCRKDDVSLPPLGTSAKDGNEGGGRRVFLSTDERAKGIGNFGPEGAQGSILGPRENIYKEAR